MSLEVLVGMGGAFISATGKVATSGGPFLSAFVPAGFAAWAWSKRETWLRAHGANEDIIGIARDNPESLPAFMPEVPEDADLREGSGSPWFGG